jgi:hypothetical protein
VNCRRKVFLKKSNREVFMKSLLKRRKGNKGKQERKGEKPYVSRNLFRQ